MFLILVLLFLILPIAEIYVLLMAAEAFNVLPVIGMCLFTAVLGGILLRMQGLSALNKAQRSMREGKVPVESAVDGVLLVVSAPFLMTPGFITDSFGFLLLMPPVRQAIGRYALKRIKRKIDRGEARVYVERY